MFVIVKKYELEYPAAGDSVQYSIYLEDDSGVEQTVSIYCSETLKAVWGVEDNKLLFENLYPLVRDEIISLFKKRISKNISEIYPISFNTYNSPKKPPNKRYKLPDKFEIEDINTLPPNVYAVFICHAIEDRELGNNIKCLLEDFDIKTFVAHDDIELGKIWEPTIIETIQASKIVVTLGTKNIETSPWVNFETGLAYDKMFPVLFDKLTDEVSYIKNKQGIIIDYKDVDKSLLKLIQNVLSKLGIMNKKTTEEIKNLLSFLNLKKIINKNYVTSHDMRNHEEALSLNLNKKRLYGYRKNRGRASLAQIFNKSSEDLIDLDIILEYIDKTGVDQKRQAMVIDNNENPVLATPYQCKMIRRNDAATIIDFPRVATKIIVTGKDAHSETPFKEEFELKEE